MIIGHLREETSFYRLKQLRNRYDICIITAAEHNVSSKENINRLDALKSELMAKDYAFVKTRGSLISNFFEAIKSLERGNVSLEKFFKDDMLIEKNFIVINQKEKRSVSTFYKDMENFGFKYNQDFFIMMAAGDEQSMFVIDLTQRDAKFWYLQNIDLEKAQVYLHTDKNKVAFNYYKEDSFIIDKNPERLEEAEIEFKSRFLVDIPCVGIIKRA